MLPDLYNKTKCYEVFKIESNVIKYCKSYKFMSNHYYIK